MNKYDNITITVALTMEWASKCPFQQIIIVFIHPPIHQYTLKNVLMKGCAVCQRTLEGNNNQRQRRSIVAIIVGL